MNEYVGKSFYKKSVLIRCDCGAHFMEIYSYLNHNNEMEFGIDWYSPISHKHSFPDFYFLDRNDFELFVNTINAFACEMEPFDSPICLYTQINLKNGKHKPNGRLEINTDTYGFLNFVRYNKFEKGKIIWDLSIRESEVIELSKMLNMFL